MGKFPALVPLSVSARANKRRDRRLALWTWIRPTHSPGSTNGKRGKPPAEVHLPGDPVALIHLQDKLNILRVCQRFQLTPLRSRHEVLDGLPVVQLDIALGLFENSTTGAAHLFRLIN